MRCSLLVLAAVAAETTAVAFVTEQWLLGGLCAWLLALTVVFYMLERRRVWLP